jgi:hypothetical protein
MLGACSGSGLPAQSVASATRLSVAGCGWLFGLTPGRRAVMVMRGSGPGGVKGPAAGKLPLKDTKVTARRHACIAHVGAGPVKRTNASGEL